MTPNPSKRLVDLVWPELPLRHQVPAILCLALGVSVTAFLYVLVSGWEKGRIQSSFEYDSDIAIEYLAREITQHQKLLVTHGQLLNNLAKKDSGEFDRHFRDFAQLLFQRHPAVDQVLVRSEAADGVALELAHQRDGDGSRPIEPRDVGLEPGLLDAAATRGRVVSSGPFPVDADPLGGYRIFVAAAVLSDTPYRDEPGALDRPTAYLCVRVALNEFFTRILAGKDEDYLHHVLTCTTNAGDSYLLDTSTRAETVHAGTGESTPPRTAMKGFQRTMEFELAGRTWEVTTAPTGTYLAQHKTDWSWWVLIGGLMLSIVLSDYFLVIAVRLAAFETMVQEKVDALGKADVQLVEQQSLHDETAAQLSRLHEAIEDCPTAIIITDTEGRVEYANYRVMEMSGCTRDELMRRTAPILDPGRLPEPLAEELQQAFEEKREWWGEYRDRNGSGEMKYLEVSTSPIRNDAGDCTHHVIMIADISERKRLQEQFLQSQKMEVIGRLAGGVVHDLSNMLTVILGFSQIVQSQLEPDSPTRNDVDEIIRVTEKAGDLNRQLLAFARTRAHQTETVDPSQTLEDMDKFLRRTLGEDIRLHVSPGENVGSIEIDPGQLNQLIMNLAVNSRDAMPEGGDLYIKTRRADLPANLCRVHRLPAGDYVMLSVRDTGFGMSEDVRARLFEPFFTTKAEGQGTGLGLSTVYGIMNQFNGAIEVESEVGEGTEFRAYFPLSSVPADPEAEKTAADTPTGNETILLVEDDPDLRNLCTALLRGLGYNVLEATGGRKGLDVFQDRFSEIDLVLTDIVMPDVNGVDLVRRMKLVCPDVRYMFTTGFSEHAVLNRIDGGSQELLRKPFTRARLGVAVREALDADSSIGVEAVSAEPA